MLMGVQGFISPSTLTWVSAGMRAATLKIDELCPECLIHMFDRIIGSPTQPAPFFFPGGGRKQTPINFCWFPVLAKYNHTFLILGKPMSHQSIPKLYPNFFHELYGSRDLYESRERAHGSLWLQALFPACTCVHVVAKSILQYLLQC